MMQKNANRPLFVMRLSGVLLCAFVVSAGGCGGKETDNAGTMTSQPTIAMGSPTEAVHTLFSLLRAERAARGADDKAAAKHIEKQLVELAAGDAILKQYQKKLGGKVDNPDEVLRTYVRGWSAMLGYYLDGAHPEQMQVLGDAEISQAARARVPADSPRERVEIEISCLKTTSGNWHIERVLFAKPVVASQPTSAPGD